MNILTMIGFFLVLLGVFLALWGLLEISRRKPNIPESSPESKEAVVEILYDLSLRYGIPISELQTLFYAISPGLRTRANMIDWIEYLRKQKWSIRNLSTVADELTDISFDSDFIPMWINTPKAHSIKKKIFS